MGNERERPSPKRVTGFVESAVYSPARPPRPLEPATHSPTESHLIHKENRAAMTASTLVRPLPESAEPDDTTTQPRPAHTPAPATISRRTQKTRYDLGFSMLELLVGMVILGVLGAIGYGVYVGFIRDARDTALDQNIQTAAAELQSVLALDPTLADNTAGVPGTDLITALTNRTNFVWDTTWAFPTNTDEREPDVIRIQFIAKNSAADFPDGANPPEVDWLVDGESAVRIHIANPEDEWRCALLVLKPSTTVINDMGGTALTDAIAAAKAAELRGIWYDGGSGLGSGPSATPYDGLHNCSPVGNSSGFGAYNSTTNTNGCGQTSGSNTDSDECLPTDAQTWNINAVATQVDNSSTAVTTGDMRTLHRSASSLDSNA